MQHACNTPTLPPTGQAVITIRTCFVLGAGASKPYGFPLGRELKQRVVEITTRPRVTSPLQQLGFDRNGELGSFGRALAGSRLPSVDAFLANRLEEFGAVGRAAIAEALIGFERRNLLSGELDPDDDWYGYLWHHLTSHGREGFKANRVSFVTFNYDRSLEWYLIDAYHHTYGVDLVAAQEAVAGSIEIVHVHGQLAPLAIGSHSIGRAYEHTVTASAVEQAAQGIVVLPQAEDNSPAFGRARTLVWEASQVVFLGLGYDADNMRRLGIDELDSNRDPVLTLMGTAYGLTPLENKRLRTRWGVAGLTEHRCLRYLREAVSLS